MNRTLYNSTVSQQSVLIPNFIYCFTRSVFGKAKICAHLLPTKFSMIKDATWIYFECIIRQTVLTEMLCSKGKFPGDSGCDHHQNTSGILTDCARTL